MPSRAAMQAVYYGRPAREGIFHIHVHPHRGETEMSGVDARETPKMMPGFQSVGREAAHGIIILSLDHGVGLGVAARPKGAGGRRARISVIGNPLGVFEKGVRQMSKERFSRQSFLGSDSEERIARCTIGVPGLGGGGSHVIQQLAHIGFQRLRHLRRRYRRGIESEPAGGRKVRLMFRRNAEAAHCENDDFRPAAAAQASEALSAGGRIIPSRCGSARSSSAALTATRAGTNLKWRADAT